MMCHKEKETKARAKTATRGPNIVRAKAKVTAAVKMPMKTELTRTAKMVSPRKDIKAAER